VHSAAVRHTGWQVGLVSVVLSQAANRPTEDQLLDPALAEVFENARRTNAQDPGKF
jgi:hypothetical protein